MKNKDDLDFMRFCGKQNLNKALNTLKGILTGVSLDGKISEKEIKELRTWCFEHSGYIRSNPFNELIPIIEAALLDGILDDDEIADIRWFLDKAINENEFYDTVTADLQILQGIMHGILADGVINKKEIEGLSLWLDENSHLAGCYPYDEVNSILLKVLADNIVDDDEKSLLKAFFSEFVTLSCGNSIKVDPEKKKYITTLGICAVTPEIDFRNRVFCFTGMSVKAKRSGFVEIIESLGGTFSNSVTNNLDYLIYGAAGNQCWAFSCYGRKVEKVMDMRKNGYKTLMVHENDFWDAYEDNQ